MVLVEGEFDFSVDGGIGRVEGRYSSIENEFLLEAIENSITTGRSFIPPGYGVDGKRRASSDQPDLAEESSMSSSGTSSTPGKLPTANIPRPTSVQSLQTLQSATSLQSFHVVGSYDYQNDTRLVSSEGKQEGPSVPDALVSDIIEAWGEEGQLVVPETLKSETEGKIALDFATDMQNFFNGSDDISVLSKSQRAEDDDDSPYDERTSEEWMGIVLKLYQALQQSDSALTLQREKQNSRDNNIAHLVEELAEKEETISNQKKQLDELQKQLDVEQSEKATLEHSLEKHVTSCDDDNDRTFDELKQDLLETKKHYQSICAGYDRRINEIKQSHAKQCADLCNEVVEANRENARLRKLLKEQAEEAKSPSWRALLGTLMFAATGILASRNGQMSQARAMKLGNDHFAAKGASHFPITKLEFETCLSSVAKQGEEEMPDLALDEFFDARSQKSFWTAEMEGDEMSEPASGTPSASKAEGKAEVASRKAGMSVESIPDFWVEPRKFGNEGRETRVQSSEYALSDLKAGGESKEVFRKAPEAMADDRDFDFWGEAMEPLVEKNKSKRRSVVSRIRRGASKRGSKILSMFKKQSGRVKARRRSTSWYRGMSRI